MKQRARRKRVQRIAFKRDLRSFAAEFEVFLYETIRIMNKRSEEVLNALQELSDFTQEMENEICKSCGKCYKDHVSAAHLTACYVP